MTRTTNRYYVRIDTLWQNSAFRYAGPFTSRGEAEQAIQQAAEQDDAEMILYPDANRNYTGQHTISHTGHGLDIKTAIRVWDILSASDAKRRGMRDSNILPSVPCNTEELKSMEYPDEVQE